MSGARHSRSRSRSSDADSDSDTNTGRRGSSERQPLTNTGTTVIVQDLNGFDDDECQLGEKKDGQLTGDGVYNYVTVRAYEFSAGSALQMPHISEEKSIIGFATLPGGEVLVAHNAVRNSKNFVDCHKLTDVFSYIKNDGPRSRELVAATKKMACDATGELIKSLFQRQEQVRCAADDPAASSPSKKARVNSGSSPGDSGSFTAQSNESPAATKFTATEATAVESPTATAAWQEMRQLGSGDKIQSEIASLLSASPVKAAMTASAGVEANCPAESFEHESQRESQDEDGSGAEDPFHVLYILERADNSGKFPPMPTLSALKKDPHGVFVKHMARLERCGARYSVMWTGAYDPNGGDVAAEPCDVDYDAESTITNMVHTFECSLLRAHAQKIISDRAMKSERRAATAAATAASAALKNAEKTITQLQKQKQKLLPAKKALPAPDQGKLAAHEADLQSQLTAMTKQLAAMTGQLAGALKANNKLVEANGMKVDNALRLLARLDERPAVPHTAHYGGAPAGGHMVFGGAGLSYDDWVRRAGAGAGPYASGSAGFARRTTAPDNGQGGRFSVNMLQ